MRRWIRLCPSSSASHSGFAQRPRSSQRWRICWRGPSTARGSGMFSITWTTFCCSAPLARWKQNRPSVQRCTPSIHWQNGGTGYMQNSLSWASSLTRVGFSCDCRQTSWPAFDSWWQGGNLRDPAPVTSLSHAAIVIQHVSTATVCASVIDSPASFPRPPEPVGIRADLVLLPPDLGGLSSPLLIPHALGSMLSRVLCICSVGRVCMSLSKGIQSVHAVPHRHRSGQSGTSHDANCVTQSQQN